MKKKYLTPQMEILTFGTLDIMTESVVSDADLFQDGSFFAGGEKPW